MIVEKQTTASLVHSPNPTVKFLIIPSSSSPKEKCYQVNLAIYRKDSTQIRLTDSSGKMLLLEESLSNQTYVIRDLAKGTYFFEVNDGFYCQIKELRISA
ncbi:MAG: T9SS type A sorting domain-containing protein [Bacteroidia bacterium]|nr:T9SS type A sorting domain-containing protein [Bacteroidia bacterium]